MALFLDRWATDCLKRHNPSLAAAKGPLVLYEKQRGAMRLVAVDRHAAQLGLAPGHTLADARALVPGLQMREIDPVGLAAAFADFADWHSYASPIVSVLTDSAPYGDLVLDITGVDHLFGGEPKMLQTVIGQLQALGFSVTGAIAGSVGAAWALAHFAPGRISSDHSAKALENLPVEALRLSESQVQGLLQMGLKRIGQLYGRDRKALQARFGASLLTRLDQALGHVAEQVIPRIPVTQCHAERRFAEPLGFLDDVLLCVRDLAIQLGTRLEARGVGAQSFHLFIYRVDYKMMRLSLNAARATRDPDHIARLFANRADRLQSEFDAGFGIDAIRLGASALSPLTAIQTGAFETFGSIHDLDLLYDRMTSRLGTQAVMRTRLIDTHVPERAVRLDPIFAAKSPGTTPSSTLPRPLRLLPTPELISVTAEIPDAPPVSMTWRRVAYRFCKASGPERIGAEWWRAHFDLDDLASNPIPNRDYYVVEDEAGRRYWIFRQGLYGQNASPRWYMHGLFP